MRCTLCKRSAVFLNPALCKKHFLLSIEKKVKETITKYKLLTKKDKIIVGVSGGKDSLTILYLLRKWKYDVLALCIDEGIAGYRPSTIDDMKHFCVKHDVAYTVVSYKEELGKTLDEMKLLLKEKPCTICGAFRRYLLNKKARELGATKLVTGHNLDDEAQAVLMNLLKHQMDLLPRLGPITGMLKDSSFIPRVKPLYFVTEKEIAAYAFLQELGVRYVECPNALRAYRAKVGDTLSDLERLYPGAKTRLLKRFVAQLPLLKKKLKDVPLLRHCLNCDEPSVGDYCKACQLLRELKQ